MRFTTEQREFIEAEYAVALHADGGERPTHEIEVRVWRSSLTLSIRTPQGYVAVPLSSQAAHAVAASLELGCGRAQLGSKLAEGGKK